MFNPHLLLNNAVTGVGGFKGSTNRIIGDGSGSKLKGINADDSLIAYAPSAAQSGKTLTHLNRIQSAVYETAFNTNENMFVHGVISIFFVLFFKLYILVG
jgi:hypothetical protein